MGYELDGPYMVKHLCEPGTDWTMDIIGYIHTETIRLSADGKFLRHTFSKTIIIRGDKVAFLFRFIWCKAASVDLR